MIISKLNQSTISVLLLFLLVLLPSNCSTSASCSTPYKFSDSICSFNLHLNSTTCQTFKFLSCSWEECSSYDYDGYCIGWETMHDTSWKKCTDFCCDDSVSFQESWLGLENCQEAINYRKKRMTLGYGLGFGIPLGIFAVFYIFQWLKMCFHMCRRPPSAVQRQGSQMRLPNIQTEINLIRPQRSWIRQQFQEHRKQRNVICSVCLDPRTSLQLECGHRYHRKCIAECVKRKKQCAMCRAVKIDHIKIYCQVCLRCYYMALIDHPNQLSTNLVICSGC